MALYVHQEIAHLKDPRERARAPLYPPQHRPHAGHHLPWVERLGNVVVSAQLQAQDLVCILDTRGQHNDGRAVLRPDRSADVEPVHGWQHEIENDQVRGDSPCLLEAFQAVVYGGDLVPFLAEGIGNRIRDKDLIFDNQDSLVHAVLSMADVAPRALQRVISGT